MSEQVEQHGQATLLDITTKEFDPYWVDQNQPLQIPNNPLHFKAHSLQVLLDLLRTQAKKNPAQFNSKNYIDALNEFTKCIQAIKDGRDEILDEGGMGEVGNGGTTPSDSQAEPISMDS